MSQASDSKLRLPRLKDSLAKKIWDKAVVNEDPNARLVGQLKEEVDTLRPRTTEGHSRDTCDASLSPEEQIGDPQNLTPLDR
ncbi:hypothetical protein PtA15_4A647 [Puccinia triticina]|uniref:Uncharacterized protein n=1 Tax=Puccinia triticina TaxID=208348 RepID=A0ABY7CHF8_9BASI|nr:uncharacterized protein PtA15_4A647 [Puccinia triticina]WAQ84195.1 hypothetical protein PtA15_4A647 [Puccinia triticina]